MALKKKRVTKAKNDELRKDELVEKQAGLGKATSRSERKTKVTAKPEVTGKLKAPVKPKVTRLKKITAKPKATPKLKGKPTPKATAKPPNMEPVKVPKEDEGKSNAPSDSETQGKRLVADEVMTEPEVDPFIVAKQTMKGSVPAIVEAMVQLAKQGSHSHAKTLLEMTGAKHMFDGESEAQGSSEPWAKLVLERLDEAEFQGEQETVRRPEESVLIAE